jgi:hypothetical protein
VGKVGETQAFSPACPKVTALARSGGIGVADCPQIHSLSITYIPVVGRFVYVAVALDACSQTFLVMRSASELTPGDCPGD